MRQLLQRVWYLLRRRQLEGDLSEELEFHLVMKQREFEERGVPLTETAFATRRALGSVWLAQDRSRDVWLPWWLQGTGLDLRLARRSLLKAPGYTCAAVVTLALAIGANSAIFSAVYAVLLKPLPIREPNQLVICWGSDPSHSLPVVELSYHNFQDWAAHSRSFRRAAAIGSSTWPTVLDRQGETARLSSAGVSISFFETLGVVPAIGRGFQSEDDMPNAPRVVVLSHRTWATRFGGDPHVVGTTIHLDKPHTVIGVMPGAFDFPRGADLWTPVVPILADSAQGWHADALNTVGVLFVIGRLHDGITPRMAADELDRLSGQLQREGAAPRFGTAVVVTPWLAYVLGPVRYVLWTLLAAVGVLVLIACANVSGLLLTRVTLRQREDAVRRALGAADGVLIRRWLMESLMLSVVGGLLGLAVFQWLAKAIVALAPDDVPRLTDIATNLPVAAFTFLSVCATALVCAAGPSWHASRSNVMDALKDAARATPSRERHRTRSLLLIVQIGLSVVLLIAAGLVVRSFVNLRQTPLGFVPSHLITMTVVPRDPKPSANEWVRELLGHVERLPGVEAVGAVYLRPLALGPIGQETAVLLDGQPDTPEAARQNPLLNYQVATPGYFRAMRIPLRQGRLFNAQDIAGGNRVALVSEGTARRLWPGQDPVGQRVSLPSFIPDSPRKVWRTVVGVVGDVRYRGIDDVRLDVCNAALQSPTAATDLVVRTSGDPRGLPGAIQAEARRLDPQVVFDRLSTMDAIVGRSLAPWRFSVWILTAFGALAFTLATVGLFSLVSLDVTQRRHEFAVRLALGAHRADIVRPVLLVAARRIAAGLGFGVIVTLGATRGIRSLLFGVGPLDVTTYGAVIALVFVVVVLASYIPARRAAGIDPLALLSGD